MLFQKIMLTVDFWNSIYAQHENFTGEEEVWVIFLSNHRRLISQRKFLELQGKGVFVASFSSHFLLHENILTH